MSLGQGWDEEPLRHFRSNIKNDKVVNTVVTNLDTNFKQSVWANTEYIIKIKCVFLSMICAKQAFTVALTRNVMLKAPEDFWHICVKCGPFYTMNPKIVWLLENNKALFWLLYLGYTASNGYYKAHDVFEKNV